MKIRPNTPFYSVLRNAPEGIAAQLGVLIINLATDTPVGPRQTSGIDEISAPSGIYRASLVSPADQGTYIVQWDDGAGREMVDDELVEVVATLPPEPLAPVGAYASQDDLDAYLEDGLPSGYDSAYLDRVLQLASQDIDLYSTAYSYGGDSPLKFLSSISPVVWESALPQYSVDGIQEATCAQAEYRLAKGDQFFVEVQRPEGNTPAEPRIGPKAIEALKRTGLQLRLSTAILQ